jgi:hypothetical protein
MLLIGFTGVARSWGSPSMLAGEYTLMLSMLGSFTAILCDLPFPICLSGVTGTVAPRGSSGTLFGTGGVGIFQWFCVCGDSPPRKVGLLLELHQLFIRVPVRLSISGCRRRKSLRAACDIGIGSETPMMAPSRLLTRECEENLEGGELAAEGDLCLGFPRQMTPNNASNAPANIPGKKPAATAAPGKRVHCAVTGG